MILQMLTAFNGMFELTPNLKMLDLSSFDLSQSQELNYMFDESGVRSYVWERSFPSDTSRAGDGIRNMPIFRREPGSRKGQIGSTARRS